MLKKNKSFLDKLDSILLALESLTISDLILKKSYCSTNISFPLLSLFNLREGNFNIIRYILNKIVFRVHNLFGSNFYNKPYKISMKLISCPDYCLNISISETLMKPNPYHIYLINSIKYNFEQK